MSRPPNADTASDSGSEMGTPRPRDTTAARPGTLPTAASPATTSATTPSAFTRFKEQCSGLFAKFKKALEKPASMRDVLKQELSDQTLTVEKAYDAVDTRLANSNNISPDRKKEMKAELEAEKKRLDTVVEANKKTLANGNTLLGHLNTAKATDPAKQVQASIAVVNGGNIDNPYHKEGYLGLTAIKTRMASLPEYSAVQDLKSKKVDTAVLQSLQLKSQSPASTATYQGLENSVNKVNNSLDALEDMAPKLATRDLVKANKKNFVAELKNLETSTADIGKQLNDNDQGIAKMMNGHAKGIDDKTIDNTIENDTQKKAAYNNASAVEKYNMREKERKLLEQNAQSHSIALNNLSKQLRTAQDIPQQALPILDQEHPVAFIGSQDRIPDLGKNNSSFTVERLGKLCELKYKDWEPKNPNDPDGPGKYVEKSAGSLSREEITTAIARWNGPEGRKIFEAARQEALNANPPRPFPGEYQKISDHGSYIECNNKVIRNLMLKNFIEPAVIARAGTTAAASGPVTASSVATTGQPYGNPAAAGGKPTPTPTPSVALSGQPLGANGQPPSQPSPSTVPYVVRGAV